MRRATLLALSFVVAGAWSQDSARGQTSVAPPVSLAAPKVSPHAGTKNPPATSGRVSSTPATSGLPQLPNPAPAADYDGFGAVDDNDTPDQAMPPARSRAAKRGSAQQAIDQEDEALKRKLMICQSCK